MPTLNTRPENRPDAAAPAPAAHEAALPHPDAKTPKPFSAYGKHYARCPDFHELHADALEAGGF
jgi:hypothetical protein